MENINCKDKLFFLVIYLINVNFILLRIKLVLFLNGIENWKLFYKILKLIF